MIFSPWILERSNPIVNKKWCVLISLTEESHHFLRAQLSTWGGYISIRFYIQEWNK